MDAPDKGVIDLKIDDFHYLSRTALEKDEHNLDPVFGHAFKGLEGSGGTSPFGNSRTTPKACASARTSYDTMHFEYRPELLAPAR